MCLEHVRTLGHNYRDFRQIADNEVIEILARLPLECGLPVA
jgi:predicted phosphoribosyltransferase